MDENDEEKLKRNFKNEITDWSEITASIELKRNRKERRNHKNEIRDTGKEKMTGMKDMGKTLIVLVENVNFAD